MTDGVSAILLEALLNSGERLFYLPDEGRYTIMSVDEPGQSSSLAF